MFKKMITLMLAVAFFTVNAHAVSQTGLKAAFDELNYTLTVETDGKNEAVRKEALSKFSAKIAELGVSNQEMMAFVKSEIKDARMAKDIETAFNMISVMKMSKEEAIKHMNETLKNSYTQGASWNGDAFLYLGALVLVVVLVAAAAAGGGSSSGGSTGGGYCSNYYVCDTTCYYDFYWGYTCYDDCYYTCY